MPLNQLQWRLQCEFATNVLVARVRKLKSKRAAERLHFVVLDQHVGDDLRQFLLSRDINRAPYQFRAQALVLEIIPNKKRQFRSVFAMNLAESRDA